MTQNAPLLFNPSRASFEELERTFVGRWMQLESLEQDLIADARGPSIRHWQLVGPRGSGKSHFTELLGRRLYQLHNWAVVRLPEEHYQVNSIAELLEQIVLRLEGLKQSPFAKESDARKVEERALDRLRSWKREHSRPVLVILENLGMLLERKLSNRRDQSRLREILMQNPSFMLLATSTSYSEATVEHGAPFYDFFQNLTLSDLSRHDVIELVEARARWDKDDRLIGQMSVVRPRVDAIFHFSGGNPRLVLALYSILRHGITEELHTQLIKLLDEVTPYYQARLSDVSPQMARILTEMALAEKILTPAEIGRRVRMSTAQVTSNINRLRNERFVQPGERPDQRSRYYELTDRLFRLWMQMREGGGGRQRIRFLTEFFQRWYEQHPDELRHDAARVAEAFWQELGNDRTNRCTDLLSTLDYLESAFPDEQRELMLKELAGALESANPSELERTSLKLHSLLVKIWEPSHRVAISYALSLVYRAMELPDKALAALQGVMGLEAAGSTTAWRLHIDNLSVVRGPEVAYAEGERILARFPTANEILEEVCYLAFNLSKLNEGLRHLNQFLDAPTCRHCKRRIMVVSILRLLGSRQLSTARVIRQLAREKHLAPSLEIDFLDMYIDQAEGKYVDVRSMIEVMDKMGGGEKAPVWAIEHVICALTHDEAPERAFTLIKHVDERTRPNRWPNLLDHFLELMVRLLAQGSPVAQEMESWLANSGFGAEAVAQKFRLHMPRLTRLAMLRPSVLILYRRLCERGLLSRDFPPYSVAVTVQDEGGTDKAMGALHPEMREAVALLLGAKLQSA